MLASLPEGEQASGWILNKQNKVVSKQPSQTCDSFIRCFFLSGRQVCHFVGSPLSVFWTLGFAFETSDLGPLTLEFGCGCIGGGGNILFHTVLCFEFMIVFVVLILKFFYV